MKTLWELIKVIFYGIFWVILKLGEGIFWLIKKIISLVRSKSSQKDSDPEGIPDRYTHWEPIIDGCVEIYSYRKVPISVVDREALMNLHDLEIYAAKPVLQANGEVHIYSADTSSYIGILSNRANMVKDWLKRGDPIRCELTGFTEGSEHVFLSFYRDEESRLSSCKSVVVKLTAYSAEDKQDGIGILVPGVKLSCAEDEDLDDKINVLGFCDEPIGRLPQKYADIYKDNGIAGVFFSHSEEDDNFKLVPYAKIYLN